jgi:hypothetical protein
MEDVIINVTVLNAIGTDRNALESAVILDVPILEELEMGLATLIAISQLAVMMEVTVIALQDALRTCY